MSFERTWLDAALILLATLGLLSSILSLWTVPRTHVLRAFPAPDVAVAGAAILLAALVAAAITGDPSAAATAAILVAASCWLTRTALPRLSTCGVLEVGAGPLLFGVGALWTYLLLQEQGFPPWALVGLALGSVTALAAFGIGSAIRLVDDAIFTHARWTRPVSPPAPRGPQRGPKVSVHVPCYAEPPDVVIKTLRSLAQMPYRDFEVIVCDNNTEDEALWRPVQQYCAELDARPGARFHFHHVSPLPGAKAGALNFCLERTAPDAELIAVVDADYIAEPDFLCRLTRFFADGDIGFVQTPHDYRCDGTAYQQMCYWEYMPPNKVGLPSLNEYDCAYTIGTMCILRRSAIEAAGGWAEWCLTEDSEISVRIRALGYRGLYVNETFGRGLIPETFADYRKQRFRWTAGPIQQLMAHWRLFLPAALGGSRALSGWVKLMETNRGLAPVLAAFGLVLGVAAAGLWGALTISGELPKLQLPAAFWIAGASGSAAGLTRLWHRYRLTGCRRVSAMLGAEAARLALTGIRIAAAIAPLGGRSLQWLRTPKFPARSSLGRALSAAAPEAAMSAGFAVAALLPAWLAPQLGPHAALLGTAACLAASSAFLMGPVVAIVGELRLRKVDSGPEEIGLVEVMDAAEQKAA